MTSWAYISTFQRFTSKEPTLYTRLTICYTDLKLLKNATSNYAVRVCEKLISKITYTSWITLHFIIKNAFI